MPKDDIDQNDEINAVWCRDSDSGEKVLICRKTNKILYRLPRNCRQIEDNRPSKQED